MLKRFSYFFAYLLLALMPLQGIAAANMSVCNSMMQAQTSAQQSVKKPCHMANMHKNNMHMAKAQDTCKHKADCKATCATFCASLVGFTAITQTINAMPMLIEPQVLIAFNKAYTSDSPSNLQRPPIFQS